LQNIHKTIVIRATVLYNKLLKWPIMCKFCTTNITKCKCKK